MMSGPGDAHFTDVDGRPAVDFGDASLYMLGEWDVNQGRWRLCLRDFRSPPIRVSSWVTLDDVQDLWSSRKAAIIQEEVRAEYGDLWRRKLDRVIHVFQEDAEQFRIEQEITEEREQSQEEAAEEPPLSPEDEEEVLAIQTSNRPVPLILTHLDNICAGEKNSKTLVFTLLLSGKTSDRSLKSMILVSGTSGVGKSTLMSIADAFKVRDVGRFTRHALDYSDLKDVDVLRLKEFGMMDAEDQGVSTIKFLSADDSGYNVEYVVRDKETGTMTTIQKTIDPITIITGTTRVDVDSQYMRRNWPVSLDESPEQTERIRLWRARHEVEKNEVALGLRMETSLDRSKRILKALVNHIELCEVLVLFPVALTDVLNAVIPTLRVRGDYSKLLTLVKLFGVLHQNSLPSYVRVLPDGSSRRVVFMLPETTINVLNIAAETLGSMGTATDKRTRSVLDALKTLNITMKGSAIDIRTRTELGRAMGGRASATVYDYLQSLMVAGYLYSEKEGGRATGAKTYYLVDDLDVIRKKTTEIFRKLQNPKPIIDDMRKEALDWLTGSFRGKSSDGDMLFSEDFLDGLERAFRGEIITPPPTENLLKQGISENVSGNQNSRNIVTDIQEPRNILCYYCRRDINNDRKYHLQVDDRDVLVCAECYGEERRILLSERIEMLFEVLPDVFHDSQNQPVAESTILMYLEERFPDDLWTGGTLEQVIKVAIRDGILFEPRPRFYLRM